MVLPIAMALLLGLGAFWGYRKLFPPDERVIRRTLRAAAQAISVAPGHGGLEKLAAIHRLVNLCTADVTVSVDAPGVRARTIQGADQLREAAAAVHGAFEQLEVRLMDISVAVAEDRLRATAQFIVRARIGEVEEEVIQECRVTLSRADGTWKIQQVEPLGGLEM